MFHTKALKPSISAFSSSSFKEASNWSTILSSTIVMIPEFIDAHACVP